MSSVMVLNSHHEWHLAWGETKEVRRLPKGQYLFVKTARLNLTTRESVEPAGAQER